MREHILYRYMREDGGITVSPREPSQGTTYTLMKRLIADKGMSLVKNGGEPISCIDTEDAIGWEEVPEQAPAM